MNSRYRDICKLAKDTTAFSSNLVAFLLEAGDGKRAMMSKPNLDVGPVDVLALADPPLHSNQRKIAFAGLTPKLFASLEEGIRVHAQRLLSRLLPELKTDGVDWMARFAFQLPMIVAMELVGFDIADHAKVKAWADHGVALLSGVNTAEDFAEHTRQSLELLEYVRERYNLMKSASEAGADESSAHCFTKHLIRATQESEVAAALDSDEVIFTDEEAVSMIFQILLAGNPNPILAPGPHP